MKTPSRSMALLAVAASALLIAGCGGRDGSGSEETASGGDKTASSEVSSSFGDLGRSAVRARPRAPPPRGDRHRDQDRCVLRCRLHQDGRIR